MPEPTQSEALAAAMAADGEIGRDALKFLEVAAEAEKARTEALKAATRGEADPNATEEETQAEETAADEVVDPQGELETREEPAAEEAQAAGLRQADYTQKLQALADQRRAVEAKAAEIDAKIARLDTTIEQLDAALAQARPDPRKLAELAASDPGAAALAKLEYREAQDRAQAARAERARIAADQTAARAQAAAEALMTQIPAFRDAETGEFNESLYAKVRAHAKRKGLPEERFNQLLDAPVVAMAYESMQAEAKAKAAATVKDKLKAAPKVLRPGAGGGAGTGRAAAPAAAEARAREALAKRPSSTEAIAAMFLSRSQSARTGGKPRVGGA